MVKVSITLPNNAQITFESEEPEVIHEIVGMVLRDLPRDLMQATVHVNGNSGSHSPSLADSDSNNGQSGSPPDQAPSTVTQESPVSVPTRPNAARGTSSGPQSGRSELTDTQRDFVAFCQVANPIGDMRRVVVAAEGASRYLRRESVDPDELGRLFDLAGWQRPHSFVQTLRNAARSKFRWLERVPGRSGQYKVTDLGRRTALSS